MYKCLAFNLQRKEKECVLEAKSAELDEEGQENAVRKRPADVIAASRKGRQAASSADDGTILFLCIF
jgi:hypothetical protein